MFIKTYKGDLVNPESIAYITGERLVLDPANVYEEVEIYKIVATMKDFTKIILCHYADIYEMRETFGYLMEEMKIDSYKIIDLDLCLASGAVSDCVHLIGEEEEAEQQ